VINLVYKTAEGRILYEQILKLSELSTVKIIDGKGRVFQFTKKIGGIYYFEEMTSLQKH